MDFVLHLLCRLNDAATFAEADAGCALALAIGLDNHLVAVGEELALR